MSQIDSRGVSSRAAITAAAGIGVFAGLAGAVVAALLNQAKSTVRAIEQGAIDAAVTDGLVAPGEFDRALISQLPVPWADGVYLPDGSLQPESSSFGASSGFRSSRPLVLAMLGDSTSVGYGTRSAADLPGVRLAKDIAAQLGRRVQLHTHGLSGCGAADLARQVAEALPASPDIVVIVVGANDIKDKVPPSRSAEISAVPSPFCGPTASR